MVCHQLDAFVLANACSLCPEGSHLISIFRKSEKAMTNNSIIFLFMPKELLTMEDYLEASIQGYKQAGKHWGELGVVVYVLQSQHWPSGGQRIDSYSKNSLKNKQIKKNRHPW